MPHGRLRPLFALLAVLSVFAPACLAPNAALAESPLQTPAPKISITAIDTSAFPEIKVDVAGRDLGVDPAGLQPTITEDGVERPIQSSDIAAVGTQTALILDASQNITLPGQTGLPQYQEVGKAIRHLHDRHVLAGESDWLAAFIPGSDGKLQPLQGWTRDHGGLSNSFLTYSPAEKLGATPLFNLAYSALDAFDDPTLDPRQQRSIVIFSDGIDVVSALKLEDVVQRAQDMNVRIYTVQLGKARQGAVSNLERLATLTGGAYTELKTLEVSESDGGKRDALDGMWDEILAGRNQMTIGYRTESADPREVSVDVALPDGSPLRASKAFPAVKLLPVAVQFVEPNSLTTIEKKAEKYDTPLADLEPKYLKNVKIAFTWPDGRPRRLTRVDYAIGNLVHSVVQPPFELASLPIASLGTGNYSVTVRAQDELGMVGESQIPLQLAVEVTRPSLPTATPTPGPPPPPVVAQYGSLVMAAAALLLGITLLIVFGKAENRQKIKETFTVAFDTLTEGWSMGGKRRKKPAQARLVVLEGDGNLKSPIELSGLQTRIGRNPNLSDLTIADPRVTRYHCRIVQENGRYMIHDEGSTAGTYVNMERVEMGGRELQSGDIINVGPISFRFELTADDSDKTLELDSTLGATVAVPQRPDPDGKLHGDDDVVDSDMTETSHA